MKICIISKALSFRDNYWIKSVDSQDTWERVNLYSNPFSTEISYTALTGETCSIHIGDEFYTGELTNRGTRAKCFMRWDSDWDSGYNYDYRRWDSSDTDWDSDW